MKTRIFTLFSLLFLTPFILLSCKATVEAGSEQIESEVFDDFSEDDLSSLTVEDGKGYLIFQSPANPEGMELSYELSVDLDGSVCTRALNAEQTIIIRNIPLGSHLVTCRVYTADGGLFAMGSSDAIFKSGQTASMTLHLQKVEEDGPNDDAELTSITASYNGGYQLSSVTPDASSFTITEHYDNSSTKTGDPSNYLVSVPETGFIQRVGSIPIKISHKNKTDIQTSVNVPYKYKPRDTYSNPTLNPNTTSLNYEQGASSQKYRVGIEGPLSHAIYGLSETVCDQVSYQWLKDGEEINGATNSEFTVPTDTAGTFKYKCKVTYTPNATYATSTTPVITYSDEITVTVTSAATDAITTWSELKTAIEDYGTNQTEKTFTITGNLEANSTISVNGNVKIVAKDGDGAMIIRSSSYRNALFNVSGTTVILALGSADNLPITIDGNKDNGTAQKSLITVSDGAELQLNNSITLQNNKTSASGGAINAQDATIRMSGGSISGNECTVSSNGGGGGGVYLEGSTMYIYGGSISDNESNCWGGGIFAKGSSTSIDIQGAATITGNKTTMNSGSNPGGGGIYLHTSANLTIGEGPSIRGNTSRVKGGGIYNSSSGNLTITTVDTFTEGNTAQGSSSGYGNNIYGKYRIGESGTEQDTLD